MEDIKIMEEFFCKVTPDGWMSFFGALLGAVLTLISILIAIRIGKKQLMQQKKDGKKIYYERLLGSLPSIDMLCSQADYLDEEDGLLGSFVDVNSRIKVMEDRMNESSCTATVREHYKHKIKCHEEYMDYWNAANRKIEEFKEDGFFNVVKSECSGNVIVAYYDFIVAFHNEHFYSGPVVRTELLRRLLTELVEAIQKEK